MMFQCTVCGKNLDESNFYRKVKNRCKDCLNKKIKCELCGKFFTKKWLATHIEREHHQQNVSNSIMLEEPIIDNDDNNNNNRTLLVGPSFSGKAYLMLKILSRISDRDIYIITKSAPEQNLNSKIKVEEISDEIKPLN